MKKLLALSALMISNSTFAHSLEIYLGDTKSWVGQETTISAHYVAHIVNNTDGVVNYTITADVCENAPFYGKKNCANPGFAIIPVGAHQQYRFEFDLVLRDVFTQRGTYRIDSGLHVRAVDGNFDSAIWTRHRVL
jgi:hypothetical protein